jgi:hypothetical protein
MDSGVMFEADLTYTPQWGRLLRAGGIRNSRTHGYRTWHRNEAGR